MKPNRTRRSWSLAMALLLFIVLGIGFLGLGSSTSVAEVLRDPLTLLADRSPGGRAAGALFSTKPPRAKPPAGPTERVLTVVRERKPPLVPEPEMWALPDQPLGYVPFEEPPQLFLVPENSVPNIPVIPPFTFERPTPPSCCAVIRPPAGPGGPAVPEPSTWVMLILGFFAAGSAIRYKVRREVAARADMAQARMAPAGA